MFNGDGGELSRGPGRKLLQEVGGRELHIPCIRSRSHTYVDARNLPFCVAAQRDNRYPQYRGAENGSAVSRLAGLTANTESRLRQG